MPKFVLEFTTTIRGEVHVEAETLDEANAMGEMMARDTVSHQEMTESLFDIAHRAPRVETEFDDITEVKDEKN